MDGFTPITIKRVGNGDAIRQIDAALEKLFENVRDPNTDAEAKRKLTFELEVKPSADRKQAPMTFQVKLKLANDSAGTDHAWLGQDETFLSTSEQIDLDLTGVQPIGERKDGQQ